MNRPAPTEQITRPRPALEPVPVRKSAESESPKIDNATNQVVQRQPHLTSCFGNVLHAAFNQSRLKYDPQLPIPSPTISGNNSRY